MKTLGELFRETTTAYASKKASSIYRRGWQEFKYSDLVRLTANAMAEYERLGLKAGDKIAILLPSCPEYGVAFFAAGLMKITCVLLDVRAGRQEILQILEHSEAKFVVCDKTTEPAVTPRSDERFIPMIRAETFHTGRAPMSIVLNKPGFSGEDLALLIYTSGTTGQPKGVMITWSNLLSNALAIAEAQELKQYRVLLSILPMNHLLEFNVGFLLAFMHGYHVAYANTMLPAEIVDRLSAYRFTDMVVVPLFLRSLMKALQRELGRKTATRIYLSAALWLSRSIPLRMFRRLIFYPVLKKLGFMERFTSGGAPLETAVQDFFHAMGVSVAQGYGLTETSPVSTATPPARITPGSVGVPVPGTEVRIDAGTGEIQVRGPHVMKGYYKMEALTAEAIDRDGWFRTGDVGHLDANGDLFITGRIKEMIVLGNGKKVLPDEIELVIAESEKFREVSVVGATEKEGPLKDTEIICAVVVPHDDFARLEEDWVRLRTLAEAEIQSRLKNLASYKKPHKVILSKQELPKTSSRKNKRLLIRKMIEEGVLS